MGRVCRAAALALALAVFPLAQAPGAPATSTADLDAARALADRAMDLYEAGKYQKAIELFEEAEAVYHAPPHVLFLGRAHAKLGKQAAARKHFRSLVREQLPPDAPEPFRQAQRDAKAELDALEEGLPQVRIELVGGSADEAQLTIDGEPVPTDALDAPLRLEPGEHVATASIPGHPEVVERFTLEEGGSLQTIELAIRPTEGGGSPGGGSPDDPMPVDDGGPSVAGPLVVLGIGVAGLGVGAITGILTLNDAAELKDRCPANPCPEEHESLADSVNTLGTTSTVAFVVGGAAVGAGLLWLLLQPDGEASDETGVRVEPLFGPLGGGVRGRF